MEHSRFAASARAALVSRAQDTAAALSVVIRSQGRFGMAPHHRIVAALQELVDSTEMTSVALLNAANEEVASAGHPIAADMDLLMEHREQWTKDQATFLTLVALGPDAADDVMERTTSSVIIDEEDLRMRNAPLPPRPAEPGIPFWDFLSEPSLRAFIENHSNAKPLTKDQTDRMLDFFPKELLSPGKRDACLRLMVGQVLTGELLDIVAAMVGRGKPHPLDDLPPGPSPEHRGYGPAPEYRRGPHPPDDQRLRRPPWMRQKEFDQLLEARGAHWFVVTMPAISVYESELRDRRLRLWVTGIALLACLSMAWAWRAFFRAADLQVQLARAEALTRHLQELNMAAAGLVHETKNPLNIIRGLAQGVVHKNVVSDNARQVALKITEEADRVTARLNKFLDYSRPITPVLRSASVNKTLSSIAEILETDREDKNIRFNMNLPALKVEADEDMFRQMLFNLLLNALEAAPSGSCIKVRAAMENNSRVRLEIMDEGAGVPQEHRETIFRPYYTTTAHGAGLGLAVVRQIAAAHGWTVQCIPVAQGSCFRISHIHLAFKGSREDEQAG